MILFCDFGYLWVYFVFCFDFRCLAIWYSCCVVSWFVSGFELVIAVVLVVLPLFVVNLFWVLWVDFVLLGFGFTWVVALFIMVWFVILLCFGVLVFGLVLFSFCFACLGFGLYLLFATLFCLF